MNPRIKQLIITLLSPVFIIGTFWLSGCEDEKIITEFVEVIVKDTVVVEIISVDTIMSLTDPITEGATVELTATATAMSGAGAVTYKWFASGGALSSAEGDTVNWKAPDDIGAYTITVHATDGTNIGIGSRTVGVGMYAPTVTPFFLGGTSCANCHAGNIAEWEGSAHAHAWATLQESGHPRSFCNPCHTVDDRMAGNSGYDDVPTAKFENVQCESCHGPASAHVNTGGAPDPTQINIDWSVVNCGSCHDGTHHPFLANWEASPHNFNAFPWALRSGGNCSGCHEGVAGAYRLSGDVSAFYGAGVIIANRDTTVLGAEPIGCVTCHDPHDASNPGQLRTVADVPLVEANGESPVITAGGVGKLCMHCHHARRSAENPPQLRDGYGHFGPHGSPQADMISGKTGYHDVAPGEEWADPSHLFVQNSCKTCHLSTEEFVSDDDPAFTGHTFLPRVEACQGCHGGITAFADIRALDDFDGNGSIEGLQTEVAGLMHLLETAIVDTMLLRGVDTTDFDFEHLIGDSSISTFKERQGAWNFFFVEADKSHGIHNPDYAVQLLQRSYLFFTGMPVPNAALLENEQKAVAKF